MNVLVTGGAGYVGSHTVLALLEAGHLPVVIDDLSTGDRRLLPPEISLVVGSAAERAVVDRTLRDHSVTAVMHCAGSIVVPDSVRNPLAYYRNNVLTSLVVTEACVSAGITRLVFSSSAAVYGIPTTVPIAETVTPQPTNPYGASKLMTERMLTDAACAHGIGVVILRYFNLAGADPLGRSGESTPVATHLIKVACQAAVGKRSYVAVYGTDYPTEDGTGVRDYVHVSDVAAAHVLALAHLEAGGESLVLNCGYGRGTSVRQVLAAVERAAGRPLPIRFGPRRPGDPPALVADTCLIGTSLGWRPRFDDLDIMVETALAWERTLS